MTIQEILEKIRVKSDPDTDTYYPMCVRIAEATGTTPECWGKIYTGQTRKPYQYTIKGLVGFLMKEQKETGIDYKNEIYLLNQMLDEPVIQRAADSARAEFPPYVMNDYTQTFYELFFPSKDLFSYYTHIRMFCGDRGLAAKSYLQNEKDALTAAKRIAALNDEEDQRETPLRYEFWGRQLPLMDHLPEDPYDVPQAVIVHAADEVVNNQENKELCPKIDCYELAFSLRQAKKFIEEEHTPIMAAVVAYRTPGGKRIVLDVECNCTYEQVHKLLIPSILYCYPDSAPADERVHYSVGLSH